MRSRLTSIVVLLSLTQTLFAESVVFRPTKARLAKTLKVNHEKINPETNQFEDNFKPASIRINEDGDVVMEWVGRDDGPKRLVMQQSTNLEVRLSATVTKREGGYRYSYYLINGKRSSKVLQSLFIEGKDISNFTSEIPAMIRPLTDFLKRNLAMLDGYAWSLTGVRTGLNVGEGTRVAFDSPHPPSVTRFCGDTRKQNVVEGDEEVPVELANEIKPWFAELPCGLTLGPAFAEATSVDLNELQKDIVKARRAGWIRNSFELQTGALLRSGMPDVEKRRRLMELLTSQAQYLEPEVAHLIRLRLE